MENLVSFYLTTFKWASIYLAKRKMIFLFRKIVLLATNVFLRLWLRKRRILKSFSGTKKVFLWILFWKKNLRQCLLSRRMNWTNTCVTKKENSWMVVFFWFFESGSFSLSFSLLFACSTVRKWRPCFVLLLFYLFRNSAGVMRGHQF